MQLYCNVDDMEDLASSVYPLGCAALEGVCPALSAVPKISSNFVTYLAGLIVVTPYIGGTADTRAAGLCEVHTDVVLKVLKLVTDAAASRPTLPFSSVRLWSGMPQRRSLTFMLQRKRRIGVFLWPMFRLQVVALIFF